MRSKAPTAAYGAHLSDVAGGAAAAACLVAASVLPSLFDARAERIFEEPKILILRSVAALAAGFLLVWLIVGRNHRQGLTAAAGCARAPLVAASSLVAAYLVASVFSIAPRIAWNGGYVRREGTYTVLCYIVFFVIVCFVVRTRKQVDKLILAFLLASTFPVVYAICQRLNLDLFFWNNPTPTRVTSTAGNSIFLGGYLIMVWPVTLARTVIVARENRRQVLTLLCLSLLAAQTAAIVLTGSVGVWLALAVVLFLILGVLLNWLLDLRIRVSLLIVALLSAGALVFVAVSRRPISDANASVAASSVSVTRSAEVRLLLWRSSVELLREQPTRALIGFGPDTIRFTLGRQPSPAVRRLEGLASADRAHNGVLDTVLTIGLVGWLCQTLFIGSICLCAMRRLGVLTSVRDSVCLATSIGASLVVCLALAYRADRTGGFLALATGCGMVAGLVAYLIGRGLVRQTAAPWSGVVLMQAAFMAGIVGYYAEVQTGIGSATSELYFWMFAALIAAPPLADDAVHSNGTVRVTAVLGVLMTIVIAFDFAALNPASARATNSVGPLVALWVTIVTTCFALAWPLRSSDSGRIEPAGSRVESRRMTVAALMSLTILVAAVVLSNLKALRADELSRFGSELMIANRFETAESFYAEAVRLQPQQDVYFAKQGEALVATFRSGLPIRNTALLERASNAYSRAYQINPREADHLLHLAVVEGLWAADDGPVEERRVHLGRASDYLDATAKLKPLDPIVLTEWGKVRLREEKFLVACMLFERSLLADDTSAETHQLYADALLGVDRDEEALHEYERAWVLSDRASLPAISGKALALARLKRFVEAIDANMQALKIAPGDYTTRKNLALLYEQTGDLARAVSLAMAAAAAAPDPERKAIDEFVDELRRTSSRRTHIR